MLKKLLLLILLGTAFTAQAEAAAPSTYRDIARLRAMNQRAQGIRPAADGKSYTTLRGNAIERHSYTKDAPGELLFEWKNDKENRDIADYQFSPDGKLLLLSIGSEPIYRHSYTTDYYLKDADGLRPILTDLSDTRDASFSPDGRLCFQRMNRRQNHFEAVLCNPDGTQQVIYDERSPKYVDHLNKTFYFLEDGRRFIVREETSTGYMHLYLYGIGQGVLHPITQGEWEVTDFVGLRSDKVYYISTESSPLKRDLYRIGLDGKHKERLTPGDGYYSIYPSADLSYYICEGGGSSAPGRTDVFNAAGKRVRTLYDNAPLKEALAEAGLPVREFFTFTTERGDELNGYMLKPLDFDPAKCYPVLLTQYSGPGSQQVAEVWGPDWEDALVTHGYIVVCVDPRGTGYRGEEFKKLTYGDLGRLEVEDQISTARYMARQSWVDPARIGIYGWSYGGFMALGCAFRGEGLFKMAIAVAPVTSWRYYDSIYTENFNGLPEDHPKGYDDNSPVNLAHLFRDDSTRLLIVHGTADDNVHFQNTMEMVRALNKLGKQYDMMVYPDQNHSMMPDDMIHVREKMLRYTLENL